MQGQIKRLSEAVAFIGLAGLIILSMVIIIDILGRELFGLPIPGFSDITEQLIIVTAAACFPASFADRSHVAVRFLGKLCHWRLREWLDFMGDLLLVAILCVFAWQLFVYAGNVWTSKETTWLIGLPIWPVWWIVTLLFTVSAFVQIYKMSVQLRRVLSSVALDDRDGSKQSEYDSFMNIEEGDK